MSKHATNAAAGKFDIFNLVVGDRERVFKVILAVSKPLVCTLEDSMPTEEAIDVAADFLTRLTKTVIENDSYPSLVQVQVINPNQDRGSTPDHVKLKAHQISITTEVYELFQAEKIAEALAMIEADLARG